MTRTSQTALVADERVAALKMKPAARYIGGISVRTLQRMIARGEIKPIRKLRHVIISIAELDKWLNTD